MRTRHHWILPVLFVSLASGDGEAAVREPARAAVPTPAPAEAPASSATQSDNWIEYTVTGDFNAEGRDADVVFCSRGDEDELPVAARGAWFMDIEIQGSGAGQHPGSFTVTLPAGLAGAPSDAMARRMRGNGTTTVSDAGTGAMGLPIVQVEFSAPELQNGGGQSIGVSGTFRCAVM